MRDAGRWLVLFRHPADFTPVCTTEFVAFTELADEFAARHTALLGNSVDSVHSHLAWTRAIDGEAGRAHLVPDHHRPGHARLLPSTPVRCPGTARPSLLRPSCAPHPST